MIEIEKYFCNVYDKLETGEYGIESLEEYEPDMELKSKAYVNYVMTGTKISSTALLKFLIIQLDYYTFSLTGNVFISDSDYDECMQSYLTLNPGAKLITENHFQPKVNTWQIKQHSAPQMVGSVEKVFDVEDVIKFIHSECDNAFGKSNIFFSPKYDGVGVCLQYDPVKVDIVSALTRKDGTYGQELIKLVKRVKNYDDIVNYAREIFGSDEGFIKCEIVMSQKDFEELIKEKPYKNRRNGTSGIINTPANIEYAKYLTVIPLIFGIKGKTKFTYEYRPNMGEYTAFTFTYPKSNEEFEDMVRDYIQYILDKSHTSEYEYRTDGVVIFIDNCHFQYPNVMSHAIAYKTNSNSAITKIVNGYISIGRTGKATPMVKVEPCDLNETVVTDVSLSNFAKVKKLGLREGDTIQIVSSGDVIPMVNNIIKHNSIIDLYFELKCPICGFDLAPYTTNDGITEYECDNPNCPRLIAGRVTNFLEKLGANGISDQTILNIYEALNIRDIIEFLDTKKYKSKLSELPDWGVQSANNFCNEIERIKNKPITHGEFLGALGIPGISTKKCKSLFTYVDYDEFMEYCHAGKYDIADRGLYEVKGFSVKSVETFMDFIKHNITIIDRLSKILTLVKDKRCEANIVFTGFRDKEAEEYVSKKGVDVSENINGQTIAVISANKNSGKTKKAIERNIPIFDAYSAPIIEICDYIIANLK